jgi:sugar-specific transcriptional regulator TrmB
MKTLKKEIDKWVSYYKKKFSLQEWEIEVKYVKEVGEGSKSPGAISSRPEYRRAELYLVLNSFKNKGLVRQVVKHELLHLFHADLDKLIERLLDELPEDLHEVGTTYWNFSRDLSERLVTKIERVVD